MNNPYNILGVSENASKEEIRSAYGKIAKMTHPDATGSNTELTAKFIEATEAYHFLMNDDNRRAYEYYSDNNKTYSESFYESQTEKNDEDISMTAKYVNYMFSQIREAKSAAISNIVLGILYVAVGFGITLISYMLADPGEHYKIYAGIIIIGIIMFIKNLFNCIRLSFLARKIKKEMWDNI